MMDMDKTSIVDVISSECELLRIMQLVEDVAIVEYDGNSVDGSIAIAHTLEKCGRGTSVVHRIILMGKNTSIKCANERLLNELYPNATITKIDKDWLEVNYCSLRVRNTLVFHVGIAIGITDTMYDRKSDVAQRFEDFVNNTRMAYYACLLNGQVDLFSENLYAIRCQLRLKDFIFKKEEELEAQTIFCKGKQDYIESCVNNLSDKDIFFQCIDEAEHGCEDCNQCGHYGQRKLCPYAQRAVARCYREGIFVPYDTKIAHQWEVMASHQNYKPACIQVADELRVGYGCKKNIDAALEIYFSYAFQQGNEHCVNQIIRIAGEEPNINRIIAVPYIARQAQDGSEDMIMKLADAFQNATYGLPKDMVQQKEWIEQGAENGNPRFVLAMAAMYEANGEWKDSYKWYKTLAEIASEMVSKEKLDEIELKMLTDGFTPEEIAKSGENYLFGYFGSERDLHLAYRCLEYAGAKDVISAKGLLGLMYLKGWGVEEDFDHAVDLLTDAAVRGDFMSIGTLIELHYDTKRDYRYCFRMENNFIGMIEDGIIKESPYALYLKGGYLSIGFMYEENVVVGFEYMKKAAELGLPKAQFGLSQMYASGTGCSVDMAEADRWLKTAAENGYYEAEGKYGIKLFDESAITAATICRESRILRKKRRSSFPFLRNAYEKGYHEAYWHLGQCYMNGIGTPVNKALAYPLYQEAAEAGILKAQELLCGKYFRGDEPLPEDCRLCAKWGEEAIRQGCRSVRFETAYSLSRLGNHERAKELYLELANEGNAAAMNNYACELSDPKDKAEWFQKAADLGSDYGLWNLGTCYKKGTGVEKDFNKAIELFSEAANKGHVSAMIDLAEIYRYGDCIDADGNKAVEWYEKAAAKNDVSAIKALAEMFSEGKVVDVDMDKAIHYYKLIAEKDDSCALYKLGRIYEFGEAGVEKNIHKAIYWYRKAANKDNDLAKVSLKRLKVNWMEPDGNVTE